MKNFVTICLLFCLTFISACATTGALDNPQQSQVQTRNYQTKSFDTSNKNNVLRNVIATMQDLGFIIEKADETLGTISGYSFTSKTTMTVTVRQQGQQCIVRANAEYNNRAVTEPLAYQNFFNALSQSLFLTANDVL